MTNDKDAREAGTSEKAERGGWTKVQVKWGDVMGETERRLRGILNRMDNSVKETN